MRLAVGERELDVVVVEEEVLEAVAAGVRAPLVERLRQGLVAVDGARLDVGVAGADEVEPERVGLGEDLLALGGVEPGVLDHRPRAEVVAGDAHAEAFGDLAHLLRRPAVVVAAQLDLRDAGVGEHLERAGQVQLVVGHQVAHGERLNPDATQRNVAGAPEAVVLVTVAPRSPPVPCAHRRHPRTAPAHRLPPRRARRAEQPAPRDRVIVIAHDALLLLLRSRHPKPHRRKHKSWTVRMVCYFMILYVSPLRPLPA